MSQSEPGNVLASDQKEESNMEDASILDFPNIPSTSREKRNVDADADVDADGRKDTSLESPQFRPLHTEEGFLVSVGGQDSDPVKIEFKGIPEKKENGEESRLEEALKDPLLSLGTPVRVKWWEWWCSFFCFKSNPCVRKVRKAAKRVQTYLDISRMLTRFIQFERALEVLFSKEQKVIFDNLPPPLLVEEPVVNAQEKKKLLSQGIINLLKKEELDPIDERLLELYEKSV